MSDPNPYLDARDERARHFAYHQRQVRIWQFMGVIALGIAGIAVAMACWQAAQSRVVPYVVEVDRAGVAVGVKPVMASREPSMNMAKAMIARAIVNFRSVTGDIEIEKQRIADLFGMLGQDSPAAATVREMFARPGMNPATRAEHEIVTVDIVSVLPLSGQTMQVEWIETVRSAETGSETQKQTWQATLVYAFIPPQTDEAILKNPIGLTITELNCSQKRDR